jgi:hypothetical protein
VRQNLEPTGDFSPQELSASTHSQPDMGRIAIVGFPISTTPLSNAQSKIPPLRYQPRAPKLPLFVQTVVNGMNTLEEL